MDDGQATAHDDAILERGREILRAEGEAVLAAADGLDHAFCLAVRLVEGCTGSVVVTGIGKAGLVARKISATLASTGTPSHFLHPAEAMHGDLGALRGDDVVLALSAKDVVVFPNVTPDEAEPAVLDVTPDEALAAIEALPEPMVAAVAEPETAPQPEVDVAALIAEDPNQIVAPPEKPKRGWWRR